MNLEIANRLYEYRKNAGLSQDQLAEKIGVSRQAVSKWERGEASPDTENLIALSEVYNVSLDELIKGEKKSEEKPNESDEKKTVFFEDGFIHVHDAKRSEEVHIGLGGIYVNTPDTKVHIDTKDVLKSGCGHIFSKKKKQNRGRMQSFFYKLPYPVLVVIAYLIFGSFDICGGWAYGWLVFLTIPLYYTLISAICSRDASHFAYPVLVVLIYFILGFSMSLWHPMWILFLTIPFYYFLCEFIKKLEPKQRGSKRTRF